MPFDYSKPAATAQRLLKQYGQMLTLRHRIAGEYADGATPITTQDENVYGAVLQYSDFDLQNTLIESNDSRVLLAATQTHPEQSDELIDSNGKTYRIIRVSPLAPAGVVVYYDIQARA